MKPYLLVAGDTAACLSIIGSVLHVLPAVVGVIAGGLAAAWYAVLLYDRLVNKKVGQ